MSSNHNNNQQPVYTCSCGSFFSTSPCPFFNRCLEPLAWSLSPADQPTSPLYTTLPKELRDMIWAYALTDTTSYPTDREPRQHPEDRRSRHTSSSFSGKLRLYPSDVAFSLLRTCKAVYAETYNLPLSLNAYVVPSLNDQVPHCRFLSWQMALIQRLDITLPQMALEDGQFSDALGKWCAEARHSGAYVMPQSWFNNKVTGKITGHAVSFSDILLPFPSSTQTKQPRRLPDLLLNHPQPPNFPLASTLRVIQAKPITHLTLRLRATDWWTWGSAPSLSSSPNNELHLDPLIGDDRAIRGSSSLMKQLAEERRTGRSSEYRRKEAVWGRNIDPNAKGWGDAISTLLPDLKVLELVLETFGVKEQQLESVASCAETWQFPIRNTKDVLVWDEEVVSKSWRRGKGGLRLSRNASWDEKCADFEVRVVRFVRRRAEE